MGHAIGAGPAGEPATKGAELVQALQRWVKLPKPKGRLGWVGGVALIIALAALSLGVYKLNFEKEDRVWARIQARQVFTVATDASYPPFAAIDANGNLFGFDIDLAEALGRRWGVKVEFETLAYDALMGSVISLRDDAVISAFVPQPERMKDVAYSRPYFTSGTVVVVRKGQDQADAMNVKDWQAWATGQDSGTGKTLAVERGAAGDGLVRDWARPVAGQAVSVTVLAEPTVEEALLAVENHSAQAALVDTIDAYTFMQGHAGVTLVLPPVSPEPYTVAVSIQSQTLSQQIDVALQAMEADGTLAALRVKWFGEAAR
jgi:ABC-type amino acid transport substrate-binding protein